MLNWPIAGEDLAETCANVQAWVHAHFIYVSDNVRWKTDLAYNGDHWETNAELIADLDKMGHVEGDCDAFAKLCWMALQRLGVPSRLVFCSVETGEGHLVCEAGGWIMDNRQPLINTRDDLQRMGYRWVAKSGYRAGDNWTAVID